MTAKELAIEVYLHEQESKMASFVLSVIRAKKINLVACIKHKVYIKTGEFQVTPQEELFVKLYNSQKTLVSAMDDLTLRAHREELAEIAFTARASIKACDDEERERTARKNSRKGFEIDVNVDETTTDAINRIQARQKKLNKHEKLRKTLEAMGLANADIEQIMSARNIKDITEKKVVVPKAIAPVIEPSRPVTNPFAAKAPVISPTIPEPVIEESRPVKNPFVKE